MHIKIEDINVAISQETIDSYIAHKAFYSAGLDWLLRNDPYAKKESEFIDKFKECLRKDIWNSLSDFDEELYDKYSDICFDLDVYDYWFEVQHLIESAN